MNPTLPAQVRQDRQDPAVIFRRGQQAELGEHVPDVATPRPAVVHHETDTLITTYTAIDPPRSAGTPVTLDGFFGWPLQAIAS